MSNFRVISQVDLDTYPSLKGKEVGDTITAEEFYKIQKQDAKAIGTEAPTIIDADATVKPEDESEAAESSRTRSSVETRRSRK
jgi:hypothetical protein